jgi:DNA-directed RNA polymerase specialized sigma24 family protein
MFPLPGEAFIERAYEDQIPFMAVRFKCRNWGVAEARAIEIAEEASAEAYKRSLTRCFFNEDHYRAWVTKTATHYAADVLRRDTRNRPCAWLDLQAPSETTNDATAEAILAAGLETLSDEERDLLDMTYNRGLTLDEIAFQLHRDETGSPNAKRLRAKRRRDGALWKLRVFLKKHGFTDPHS